MEIPLFDGKFLTRVPQVYRYMAEVHVDQFFADGSLRLSSFQKCRETDHAARGDVREGFSRIEGYMDPGYMTCNAEVPNAYLVCTSSMRIRSVANLFGAECAIAIADPIGFAMEVAKVVPNFKQVFFGECNYNTQLLLFLPGRSANDIADRDAAHRFVHKEAAIEPFFHKMPWYRDQSEYRFVFTVEGEARHEFDIKVPKARKFCMKMTDFASEPPKPT